MHVRVFLVLVVLQAFHSAEEYFFGLYEVFAPARLVSRVVPGRPDLGFLLVQVAILAFGLWCYLAQVRPGRAAARPLMWLWAVVSIGNGVGHPLMAWLAGGYFPGLATAPLQLLVAAYLALLLARD